MPAPRPRLKQLPDGPYIEIDGDSLYLGRDCHLAPAVPGLQGKVVSNRHCCIKKEPDGRWTVEDLHSTNGTWLRGHRLTGREALATGDVLVLGRSGAKFLCDFPMQADPNATLLDDEEAGAETLLISPDGSAERPYRVGTTPEVEVRHERTGDVFSAKGYTIVLGRDRALAQIVIHSPLEKHVSARHAEIQFRSDGRVVLRDLGSRNGTWLNGRRLSGETQIKLGDRLMLGASATTLVVRRLES